MSRDAFDVYERGFDEDTGKTIGASKTCQRISGVPFVTETVTRSPRPALGGAVRAEGGQIDCLSCGVVLNDYARTGRVPDTPQTRTRGRPPEETA
jgi:hypothetical protein